MQRGPITDSPLFWLMLFASVGLLMLAAVEPKFAKRQQRIERMQQSRQGVSHGEKSAGEDAAEPVERWQPREPASLRPLMLFVAALLMAAMIGMQVRFRKQRRP